MNKVSTRQEVTKKTSPKKKTTISSFYDITFLFQRNQLWTFPLCHNWLLLLWWEPAKPTKWMFELFKLITRDTKSESSAQTVSRSNSTVRVENEWEKLCHLRFDLQMSRLARVKVAKIVYSTFVCPSSIFYWYFPCTSPLFPIPCEQRMEKFKMTFKWFPIASLSLLRLSVSIRFGCSNSNTRRNGPTCSNRLSLSHNSSARWHPQPTLVVSTAFDVAHRFPFFFPETLQISPSSNRQFSVSKHVSYRTCHVCVFSLFLCSSSFYRFVLCSYYVGVAQHILRRRKRDGRKFTHYTKKKSLANVIESVPVILALYPPLRCHVP